MTSIYEPAEDSFLISRNLRKLIPKQTKKNPNLKFMEIGSGSGINLKTSKNAGIKKQNIFSTDINSESVKHCKKLGFKCVKSNLFDKINKKQKFDLIIFNPPYLPEDSNEPKNSKLATTGGQKGNELAIKFLKQGKDFLNPDGKMLIITSSLAKNIDFKKLKLNAKILDDEKLFFEKLLLWEITF